VRYVQELKANPSLDRPLFSTVNQKPHSKKKIPDEERLATTRWFLLKNPSRSGDTIEIAWMSLRAGDFYYSVYRREFGGVLAQAVKMFPYYKSGLSGARASKRVGEQHSVASSQCSE
jgi:hypothetical protein